MSSTTSRLHSDDPSALPVGTRLDEFELRGLLGVGGFGIVYLAFDHVLEREVAVKEYMPVSLACRTETLHVSLRSRADVDTFTLGLKSFVNEAKLLAHFDHPSLLKVYRFWEANGTAYMAMPVMRGRSLEQVRAEMSSAPDEAWLRNLLTPLLSAIEKLHSEGVYHRDIAPDNIQIEPGGHPVLLDFGAARRVITDKSHKLTAILKPAYAPIEQYAEAGSVKQGPWTDLYALGATLYFLLLNRPPPPATARSVHDETSALTAVSCPGCSENFLRAIDWMLAPRPIDRPQSVAALREVLAPAPNASSPPTRPKWLPLALGLGVLVAAVVAALALWPRQQPLPAPTVAASAPATESSATRASSAEDKSPPTAAPRTEELSIPAPNPVSPTGKPDRPARPTLPPKPRPATPPTDLRHQAIDPSPVPPVVEAPPVQVEAPKPAQQTGPEGNCAGLNTLSHVWCMERECRRSEFRAHPDCKNWYKASRREGD